MTFLKPMGRKPTSREMDDKLFQQVSQQTEVEEVCSQLWLDYLEDFEYEYGEEDLFEATNLVRGSIALTEFKLDDKMRQCVKNGDRTIVNEVLNCAEAPGHILDYWNGPVIIGADSSDYSLSESERDLWYEVAMRDRLEIILLMARWNFPFPSEFSPIASLGEIHSYFVLSSDFDELVSQHRDLYKLADEYVAKTYLDNYGVNDQFDFHRSHNNIVITFQDDLEFLTGICNIESPLGQSFLSMAESIRTEVVRRYRYRTLKFGIGRRCQGDPVIDPASPCGTAAMFHPDNQQSIRDLIRYYGGKDVDE